ncbi:MAG: Rieske 2Fe-2S domain-containing protein [Alphaproteobacteria bacterium]|nr:Rieske 2Fe-2S domain-containing protein [Alphaproteobacteria bacterium]MCB9931244.1 Rieske 2Fe-2S domain-containing protein [Alphaproteobacteria bacterium]
MPRRPPDGSAYDLPAPEYDAALTRVERGTPMGELLRRYWHPVGLASDASARPKPVRVLGEDLILFRDGGGRPGLLYPRCCHRGTTLYYGKVEAGGIRCCYHGWLFDAEGHCLDMPMEPEGGGNFRRKVRQPWYPLRERYGLIFAYLGPPARQPLLPRYTVLEELDDGEFVEADDQGIGTGGGPVAPCNWLQHYENVMDPLHVPVLHDGFSGTQFVAPMGIVPDVRFEPFAHGVRSYQVRQLPEGGVLNRITETVLPTVRVVASPRLTPGRCESIGWVLPIDSETYTVFTAARVREAGTLGRIRSRFGGRLWSELSEREHQDLPGDWEAQVGQGPITYHSQEHLGSSDRGIILLRKRLRAEAARVAAGEDPAGVAFAPADALVESAAGNWFRDAPLP